MYVPPCGRSRPRPAGRAGGSAAAGSTSSILHHFLFFEPEGLPYKFLVFCSGGGQEILQRL